MPNRSTHVSWYPSPNDRLRSRLKCLPHFGHLAAGQVSQRDCMQHECKQEMAKGESDTKQSRNSHVMGTLDAARESIAKCDVFPDERCQQDKADEAHSCCKSHGSCVSEQR